VALFDKLRQIFRDAATAIAVTVFGYKSEEQQRLKAEGYLEDQPVADVARASFFLGTLHGRSPEQQAFKHAAKMPGHQLTFDEILERMRRPEVPLSDIEQRAMEHAATRAGECCVALGDQWGGQVVQAALDGSRVRTGIAEETAAAIEERQTKGALRSRLRQMTGDWSRDWDRIANTEMQTAFQEGVFESTVAQHGMEAGLAKIPNDDACHKCKELYLENGKPRIMPATWWEGNGTNVGKKQAEWVATVGTLHPNCRCAIIRCPAGWGFTDDWELVPPDEEKGLGNQWHLGNGTYMAILPLNDGARAQLFNKAGLIGYEDFSSIDHLLKAFDDVRIDEATGVMDGFALNWDPLQKNRKLHYRTTFAGLEISIENRRGSYRRWKNHHDGTEGKTFMSVPYGYIRLTEGLDGDHLDCFLGPNEKAATVYVVTQLKAPTFKTVDENKVMLGFDSRSEAERAYLAHYNSPDFYGSITEIQTEVFVQNVKDGKYKSGGLIKGSPPGGGWEPAPHTKHGGMRKRVGGAWEYWYPEESAGRGRFELTLMHHRDRVEQMKDSIKIGGEYKAERGNGRPDRYVAVLHDPSDPGKVRLQHFDEEGFSGHQTFDKMDDLIHGLASDYEKVVPASGIMDKLAITEKWAEGTARASVMQVVNTLGFHRQHDAQRAVNDFWEKHGSIKTARMLSGKLPELLQGKIPDALKTGLGKALAPWMALMKSAPTAGAFYDGAHEQGQAGAGAWLVDRDHRIKRLIQLTTMMDWLEEFREQQKRTGRSRIVIDPKKIFNYFEGGFSMAHEPPQDVSTLAMAPAREETIARNQQHRARKIERHKEGVGSALKLFKWAKP